MAASDSRRNIDRPKPKKTNGQDAALRSLHQHAEGLAQLLAKESIPPERAREVLDLIHTLPGKSESDQQDIIRRAVELAQGRYFPGNPHLIVPVQGLAERL